MTRTLMLGTVALLGTTAASATAQRVSPGKREFWIAGSLTLAATIPLDTRISEFAVRHQSETLDRIAGPIGRFGSPQYIVPVAAAAVVVPLLFSDEATSRAAADIGIGYLVAGGAGEILRRVIGRHRPDSTGRSMRFSHFAREHAWHSFPSGHTVGTMALATAISLKSDRPWVTWTTFSLASVVGLQRIYRQEHWASDVVAGTLLGIVTSASTIRWRERQRIAPVP